MLWNMNYDYDLQPTTMSIELLQNLVKPFSTQNPPTKIYCATCYGSQYYKCIHAVAF